MVGYERTSTLEQDLQIYLDWLCVEWGFCIPSIDANNIAQSERMSSTAFASAVLKAEGLDDYSLWFKKIKIAFEARFGAEVNATTYVAKSLLNVRKSGQQCCRPDVVK